MKSKPKTWQNTVLCEESTKNTESHFQVSNETFCSQIHNVYDAKRRSLVVGPYSWEPQEDALRYAELPDHVIRKVSGEGHIRGAHF